MKIRKNQWSDFFQISWKKVWIVIVAAFLSIILHNLISAIFGSEEAVFFTLTFLILLYFLVSVIYSVIRRIFK